MIEIINPGIQTTIQDMGRFGYRSQGVPLSGAMDQYSSQLGNQLLGNKRADPVMEFVMQGPELIFHQEASIAISGGDWDARLNGTGVDINEAFNVQKSDRLKIKGTSSGMYGYLCISGGFQAKKVLGSYSNYQHLTGSAALQKGDLIKCVQNSKNELSTQSGIIYKHQFIQQKELSVMQGPEFGQLDKKVIQQLTTSLFQVSPKSSRMAFLLNHNAAISAPEITTGVVQPGTVQMTPSGKIIVLMRDAQTTGGYSRIFQLPPHSINILAQKQPGSKISFRLEK